MPDEEEVLTEHLTVDAYSISSGEGLGEFFFSFSFSFFSDRTHQIVYSFSTAARFEEDSHTDGRKSVGHCLNPYEVRNLEHQGMT